MDAHKKRKRGPYKKYLEPGSLKTIPQTTLFSRKKAALEAERNAQQNAVPEIIGEVGVPNNNIDPNPNAEETEQEQYDQDHINVAELTQGTSVNYPEEESNESFQQQGSSQEELTIQDSAAATEFEGNYDSEGSHLSHSQDSNHEDFQDNIASSDSSQDDEGDYGSDSQDSNNEDFHDDIASDDSSQDDEGDAGVDARKETDYVKKYYLNNRLHPNFPHSKLEVLLMILHMAIRHCHTQHFIEHQIKFVNTLFGANVLDISFHMFKNIFPSSSSIERHFFCDSCEIYIGSQKDFPKDLKFKNCPKCDKSINVQSVDSGNYFISLSIKEQIETIFKRSDIKLIPRGNRTSEGISDIFDGELYKKLSQPESNLGDFLTCIINTDGVRVFENSDQGSLWPVFLHLNEIAPELRFKTENLILGGLWFGKGAPNMALYLKPVLNQLLALSQTGVSVPQPDGRIRQSRVFAIGASVDSVAKAKLLCQRQFNGGYSCLYCTHPNDAVAEEGNSNLKHFETSASYPNRTHDEVMKDMLEADTLERTGQLKKSSVRGFLGLSILLMFHKLVDSVGCNPFHIVWSVVIDYMHALLEGVASDLLALYLCILSEEQINIVNNRLDQITLPQGMSRKPRHVGGKVKYKAKEYRSFFLYFAVPCFEDLLPVRNFSHLKLFVSALHVLLGDCISATDLQRTSVNLQNFVTGFKSIYGLHRVTYNLHLCSHLIDQVLQSGPLWCYSNFIFESGNGILVKLVRGTRSVVNEISIKFTRLQGAYNCIDSNPVNNDALGFCNDILGCKYRKGEKFHGVSVTGSHSFMTVSNEERVLLEEYNVSVLNDKVKVYNRVVRNGIVYVSKSYSKARTTNDSCVQFLDGSYGTIDKIVATPDHSLKCLVRPIRIAQGNILLQSIKKCSFYVHAPPCIVSFDQILRKCVFISFSNKSFVCHMPNVYERD